MVSDDLFDKANGGGTVGTAAGAVVASDPPPAADALFLADGHGLDLTTLVER